MQEELGYRKYVQLIARRKERFVAVALLITTAVFAGSYLYPRKYEASSTVFIEKNVINELVKGISVTPSMEDTINVLTYAITSRTLLTKVVDSLDMSLSKNEIEMEALVKRLQHDITVKVKEKNDLFTITFVDGNPRLARDFVNTLVRMYIEENISSKRGESYDATNFLSDQIHNFNTKLEKAEAQVNAYKRENGGIIAIDEGKLFEQINIAQAKLYDLQLRRRQLEGGRQASRKSSDPLQVKLFALEKQLSDLRVQYTESYPEVVKVKGDIDTVRQQLLARKGGDSLLDPQEVARVDSEIAAIKVTEQGFESYIAANRGLLERIPTAKAGLEKLEMEKKNQSNIYDQLVSRHGQSEVSKQMEVQDKTTTFRVIDPAVLPVRPVSPDRLVIMLIGLVAGFSGSLGLLVFLDQVDSSVKEVDTAKGFGLPVLAVVPLMKDPVTTQRQHRRSVRMLTVATVYFLLLLCFPVMELLQLPYMDKALDSIYPVAGRGGKGALR